MTTTEATASGDVTCESSPVYEEDGDASYVSRLAHEDVRELLRANLIKNVESEAARAARAIGQALLAVESAFGELLPHPFSDEEEYLEKKLNECRNYLGNSLRVLMMTTEEQLDLERSRTRA